MLILTSKHRRRWAICTRNPLLPHASSLLLSSNAPLTVNLLVPSFAAGRSLRLRVGVGSSLRPFRRACDGCTGPVNCRGGRIPPCPCIRACRVLPFVQLSLVPCLLFALYASSLPVFHFLVSCVFLFHHFFPVCPAHPPPIAPFIHGPINCVLLMSVSRNIRGVWYPGTPRASL